MTVFEAIETVLGLAKAELDNSREDMNVEAVNDMEEAITTVGDWIDDIRLGRISRGEF